MGSILGLLVAVVGGIAVISVLLAFATVVVLPSALGFIAIERWGSPALRGIARHAISVGWWLALALPTASALTWCALLVRHEILCDHRSFDMRWSSSHACVPISAADGPMENARAILMLGWLLLALVPVLSVASHKHGLSVWKRRVTGACGLAITVGALWGVGFWCDMPGFRSSLLPS